MKKTSIIAIILIGLYGFNAAVSAVSLSDIKNAAKKEIKDLSKSTNKTTSGEASKNVEEKRQNVSSSDKSINFVLADEDDFNWKTNDEITEIIITEYIGNDKEIKIPESIQGLPVTELEQYTFSGKTNIERVVLPETIKKIGIYCFSHCISLESVILPDGLKVIPEGCFSECTNLTTINFPSSLLVIGDSAFFNCPFTSVDIPEGVEYLGGVSVFYSNTIVSVSIPKSLKWIKEPCLDVIYGDNINEITIAEGCSPTIEASIYGSAESCDGRRFMAGEKIAKSVKLQKQLSTFKINAYSWSSHAKILKKDYERYGLYFMGISND